MSKIVLEDFNEGNGYYKVNLAYLSKEQVEEIEALVSKWNPTDEDIKSCIEMCLTDVNEQRFKDYNTSLKDCLNWLEKQGQEKHLSEPIKDYQGSFTCWNNAHDFRPKHLQRCICYDKYMRGVYCYVYDDISKYWCTQTTEEHDPDGDNHICDYADYRVTAWMSLPETSFYSSKSLLEKQEIKPKGKSALEAIKEEKVDNANKVERKFKVGDFIVNDYCKGKVIELTTDAYLLDTGQGIPFSHEHNAHLWTIADAREGDILTFDNNVCTMGTIICKSPTSYDTKSYCRLMDEHFIEKEESGWDSTLLVPSTKEQRDALMKAMNDVGYEWDEEKKELRKIKQKSAWSEEDDVKLNDTINLIEQSGYVRNIREHYISWLQSLKQRATWKPSEEQIEVFEHFVRSIGESGYASPYDNNTKLLYSLLSDLKKL